MKLRLDLLKFLTPEDVLEDAGFDVHRWSAEPVFAKTGLGLLKPATEEDKAAEMARSEKLILRLKERAAREASSLDSSEL